MKLKSYEKELKGNWRVNGNKLVADDTTKRIDMLISECLIEVGIDKAGWARLFIDPDDYRYWELSYPQSEMHGGGAPTLKNLSKEEVHSNYGNL